MGVVHIHVKSALKVMFPSFTGELFNPLGDRLYGLKERGFNNELYREVSVKIAQLSEDGNEFFFTLMEVLFKKNGKIRPIVKMIRITRMKNNC